VSEGNVGEEWHGALGTAVAANTAADAEAATEQT